MSQQADEEALVNFARGQKEDRVTDCEDNKSPEDKCMGYTWYQVAEEPFLRDDIDKKSFYPLEYLIGSFFFLTFSLYMILTFNFCFSRLSCQWCA